MTRIVEHRSALPFGTVVEVHVHRGPVADTPMLATVNVANFSSRPDPDFFVDPPPVADAAQKIAASVPPNECPMRNGGVPCASLDPMANRWL